MEKIFVIEDDENIRELVQIALEGYGYEVEAFETAEKDGRGGSRSGSVRSDAPWHGWSDSHPQAQGTETYQKYAGDYSDGQR